MINESRVVLAAIQSYGVSYFDYREDPLFPARSKNIGDTYSNNSTLPSVIGCIDATIICRLAAGYCRLLSPEGRDHPYVALTALKWLTSRNKSITIRQADMAHMLLTAAVDDSLFMTAMYTAGLVISSLCRNNFCYGLPTDQWKVEVRRWFETSLALIQGNVLDVVRGTGRYALNDSKEEYHGIPPEWRGLYQMGKFKSVGWRNVSTWGFLGLLTLAGAITLASVRNGDDGDLCFVIGVNFLFEYVRRGVAALKTAKWAQIGRCILTLWAVLRTVLSVQGVLLGKLFRIATESYHNSDTHLEISLDCRKKARSVTETSFVRVCALESIWPIASISSLVNLMVSTSSVQILSRGWQCKVKSNSGQLRCLFTSLPSCKSFVLA